MTIGRVMVNVIENDHDSARMRRRAEAVEFIQRAEQRIDVTVIADIVSEVGHRRRIDRRHPDRVDTEPAQIVQTLAYSLEVADPVAICVLKRARVDLVNDPMLPPNGIGHRRNLMQWNVWYRQLKPDI